MTTDTLSFILALGGVAALVLAIYIASQFPGCSGDCRQGRDPCDCKDD